MEVERDLTDVEKPLKKLIKICMIGAAAYAIYS